MGSVLLAQRDDDQYRKRVALKLLRPGFDSEDVVRRFRRERQILASLEHPNIASLLDGGTTDDGLPYLVMEYVEGLPIDRYCDRHRLSVDERLRLFCLVCGAVQFAHQNLIVHRDIKPRNVLVGPSGAPKLLDFGIAKLLDPGLWAQPGEAAPTEHFLMTPEYASPEQVRGEPITTASDVYSLGVLLYELLTGQRPYEVTGRSLHEITRAVCEKEPTRPSAAIDRAMQTREGSAGRLRRRLRGDLDNIVLMALRKEPARRYASVEQLSEDVRRHLEGLPVRARKATFAYRARKFVLRNRGAVAAAVLVFASLGGGIVATRHQARVAERRFGDVRKLAQVFLYDFHDAIEPLPGSTPARRLLVTTALDYLDRLSRESGRDVSLQMELAQAYFRVGDVQGSPNSANLGDLSGALASYEKGLAVLEKVAGAAGPGAGARRDLASGYERVAAVRAHRGETESATELVRRSLALREAEAATSPEDPQARPALAAAYAQLGSLLEVAGEIKAALDAQRKGLAIREARLLLAPGDPGARRDAAVSYEGIGRLLSVGGDTAGALASARKAHALREELAAASPGDARAQRDLATSSMRLADATAATGDLAGALAIARGALPIFERLAAADPQNARARRDLHITYRTVGNLLSDLGKPREALDSYHRALRVSEELAAADPRNADSRRAVMILHNDVGDVLGHSDFVNFGDRSGALASYRKGLAIAERLAAADGASAVARRDLWVSLGKIGRMLEAGGDTAGALSYLERARSVTEAIARMDETDARAKHDLSISHEFLGLLKVKTGDVDGGIAHHRRALEIREALAAEDALSAAAQGAVATIRAQLGVAYLARADRPGLPVRERIAALEDARASLQEALSLWRRLEAQGRLDAMQRTQPEEVVELLARCEATLARLSPAEAGSR
jgi:non-specific serine/threonine protein kinase/serine/threonine-protein kinase